MPRTFAVTRLVTAFQMAAAGAALVLIALVVLSFAVPGVVHTRGALIAQSTASLFDDAQGVAIFPGTTQVLPNQPISGCISINAVSAGPKEAVLLQAANLTGTLAPDLSLTVQSGTGGRAGDCSHFTGRTVWSGTLRELAADPGASLSWDPHSSPQRSFRITANARPVHWRPGRNATADLVWRVIYTGSAFVPGSQAGPPADPGPSVGVLPVPSLPPLPGTSRPVGPVGPVGSGAGLGADITLRPSGLSELLNRATPAVLGTLGSPQYPVSALTIVLIFVAVEQWYERRAEADRGGPDGPDSARKRTGLPRPVRPRTVTGRREIARMNGFFAPDAGRQTIPLSLRIGSMMLSRVLLCPVTYAATALAGQPATIRGYWAGAVYLVVTGALSCLAVLTGRRRAAICAFGLSLLLDSVFLQYQHETLGHSVPVDLAIATHLSVVCLLASFRSGLAMALWQTILMVFALRGEQSALFRTPGWAAGLNRERILVMDCGLFWVAVLAACLAAAINERELRRRRYDAEALRTFADGLQADHRPRDVSFRLARFVAEELLATRVMVCHQSVRGWRVEAASWPPAKIPRQAVTSTPALFLAPPGPDKAVLALRLDPVQDPWLDSLMPNARRLLAFPLNAAGRADQGAGARWLVIEQGNIAGRRISARMISIAAQAASTATIAVSRARLVEAASRAAATDGLTGLANRRRFDARIEQLITDWRTARRPFALILLEVDRFGSVNDRYGPQVGDQTLQRVAAAIRRGSREVVGAIGARYGGEEFAVLLPNARLKEAVHLAERIRVSLHQVDGPAPITASFGVAGVPGDAFDVETLIKQADAALIRAKESGRDQVVAQW